MKLQDTQLTITTLANAVETTCCVVQQILGGDVASTFNGSPLTRASIQNLALAEIKNNLVKQTGVL